MVSIVILLCSLHSAPTFISQAIFNPNNDLACTCLRNVSTWTFPAFHEDFALPEEQSHDDHTNRFAFARRCCHACLLLLRKTCLSRSRWALIAVLRLQSQHLSWLRRHRLAQLSVPLLVPDPTAQRLRSRFVPGSLWSTTAVYATEKWTGLPQWAMGAVFCAKA